MFPWHFHKRVAEDLASYSLLLTISSHPKGKKAFWENPDKGVGVVEQQENRAPLCQILIPPVR